MAKLKNIFLKTAVFSLRMLYIPMRLFRVKNRITIISRQSDTPTRDNAMLAEALRARCPDTEIRILSRKFNADTGISPGLLPEILRQAKALASSQVIVADGYCIPVSVLPHPAETSVVQTWHSLAALKKFGYQTIGLPSGSDPDTARIMHMHEGYDYVLAPGKFTAESFCRAFHVPEERIVLLGLPRIDVLLNGECPAEEIRSRLSIDSSRPTALYAPTFRKGKQINVGPLIEEACRYNINLIIRTHPLDTLNIEHLPENIVIDHRFDTYDLMKFADMIISDYSAVGIEALLLEKPVYFYLYDIKDYARDPGLNVDYQKEFPGMAFRHAADLMRSAAERDYPFSRIKTLKNKYFECDTANCTQKLAEFIAGLLYR